MIDIEKTKENINNMMMHRSKPKKRVDERLTAILEESLKRADTHDVLFYQAYHIAFNDNKKFLKNLEFERNINWYVDLVVFHDDISRSIKRLKPSYSKKPDRSFLSTLYIFGDHFYNAKTEANYFGNKKFTAMFRFKKRVHRALKAQKRGDRKRAMIHLCYACHFLADMNEPHHVSNQIDKKGPLVKFLVKYFNINGIKEGKFSNHGAFECRVKCWIKDGNKIKEFFGEDMDESFLLDTMPLDNENFNYLVRNDNLDVENMSELEKIQYIYTKNNDLSLDDYCEYIGRESASYATTYVEDCNKNDTQEQMIGAIRTLNMTQIQLARFLYYFCNLE
ncbi:zinc dependent phospholipase C family protein [Clostridium mediterraneense]|uniref:zinc dependent phospholipase C family protein n=1 Tax=Clostridium mediterraneense TaxID=1805472 RepID=UPI00082D11EA|nr:zinc dependent phospholipase C family protein [Clostridium mediterraneense]